jgi:hypothetical protein
LCYFGEGKVVITPPVFFGRGYVFDGKRQVIEICRRVLGIPVAESEVRFSDATLFVESIYASDRFLKTTARADEPPSDSVMSAIVGLFYDGVFNTVADCGTDETAAMRIAAAVERLGVNVRKRFCHMEL